MGLKTNRNNCQLLVGKNKIVLPIIDETSFHDHINDCDKNRSWIEVPGWAIRHTLRSNLQLRINTLDTIRVPVKSICKNFNGTAGSCGHAEDCKYFHIAAIDSFNKKKETILDPKTTIKNQTYGILKRNIDHHQKNHNEKNKDVSKMDTKETQYYNTRNDDDGNDFIEGEEIVYDPTFLNQETFFLDDNQNYQDHEIALDFSKANHSICLIVEDQINVNISYDDDNNNDCLHLMNTNHNCDDPEIQQSFMEDYVRKIFNDEDNNG